MPDPSAGTTPSLFASKGLLALVGSSLLTVDSAFITLNPPRPSWLIPASVPPDTMTSADPLLSTSSASPTPCVPAAHDVVTVLVKPFNPSIRLTWEVAMLGSIIGKKKGLSRIPPLVSTVRPPTSMSGKPPHPLPNTIPSLAGSSDSMSSPDSSMAARAAVTAIWLNLDMRLASRASSFSRGLKSGISPAILVG